MLSRGQTGELLDGFGQQVALANVSSLHSRGGIRKQEEIFKMGFNIVHYSKAGGFICCPAVHLMTKYTSLVS